MRIALDSKRLSRTNTAFRVQLLVENVYHYASSRLKHGPIYQRQNCLENSMIYRNSYTKMIFSNDTFHFDTFHYTLCFWYTINGCATSIISLRFQLNVKDIPYRTWTTESTFR